MPEGTGINKIPAATASTIPHRSNLLRKPILSAGSSLDCSGGSDDGCSTRSSFDWGEHNNARYYSLSRLLLKHFHRRESDGDFGCVSIWRTSRLIMATK